jgi:hypothetical protein
MALFRKDYIDKKNDTPYHGKKDEGISLVLSFEWRSLTGPDAHNVF